MITPKMMCSQHILGEHRELHALAGTLLKGTSIQGYIDNNLVEVQSIILRHTALVNEMIVRGYKHLSPMIDSQLVFEHLTESQYNYVVDRGSSFNDLYNRCPTCAWRSYIFYNEGYELLNPYYVDNSVLFNNQYGIYGLKYRSGIIGQCETCYWWDHQSYQYGPGEYEVNGHNKGYCMANDRKIPTIWEQFCDIDEYKERK
jgi:hypothetical protein